MIRPRSWRWALPALLAALFLAGAAWLLREPLLRWQAERSVVQARSDAQDGRVDAARARLLAVLARDPRHHAARRQLAELELAAGRLERAYLHWQALTELHPSDPAGWLGLAQLQLRAGLITEPLRALDEALRHAQGPADLQVLRLRGELRARLAMLAGARRDAHAVLALVPGDRAAQALLETVEARIAERPAHGGVADPPPLPGPSATGRSGALWPGQLAVAVQQVLDHARAQRFDAALAVADAARAEYPATLFGPWLAGIVELGRGDAAAAETRLREALAQSPRSTRVLTLLARTWSRQGGAAHAGDALIELVERDPGFALPWQIAAHAYVEARQPARAEAALRRGFAWPAAGAVPYRELAALYLELDRPADAFRIHAEGLARFPDDAVLLAAQARLQLRAGDGATAVALLERAHAADPDNAEAALALAGRLAQGDAAARTRALALARQVALDTPRAAEVLGALGAVLLDAGGSAAAARDHLRAAVQLAPEDPAPRYRLALALRAAGEPAEARRALEAALALPGSFAERPQAQALLNEWR